MTTTSTSAKLSFSTNLLFFDTVFATGTTGSSVRIFVVHNNNSQAVVVSSIKLAGQYTSPFEVNVDGLTGPNLNNIKIPANDSIYVFVQVNINPLTGTNGPAVIQDSLVFTTNGNTQWVNIQAFGWNANYYTPNVFPRSGPAYAVVPCGTVWTSAKPTVILGYLLDTTGCTLTIQQGTHVYLHGNAVLYIQGTLKVNGISSAPVTFAGDRLEPGYNYPGQWNEIFLAPGSINNNISWAVIQNGTTGLEVDTVGNSSPTLTMDHTIIKDMSANGLLGQGATIVANNCLIADCQSNCVLLNYGGDYHFYQCTFANYWGVDNSYGQRTSPILSMNNGYQSVSGTQPRALDSAFFGNCIIYGALNDELELDSNFTAAFNYYFENCVIRTGHSFTGYHNNGSLYLNQDPAFANPGADNYILNGGSSALGHGNAAIGTKYPIDLTGSTQSLPPYAIGAYWQ